MWAFGGGFPACCLLASHEINIRSSIEPKNAILFMFDLGREQDSSNTGSESFFESSNIFFVILVTIIFDKDFAFCRVIRDSADYGMLKLYQRANC